MRSRERWRTRPGDKSSGLVWGEERTAGDIADRFAMSRPAVSQHLVAVRREGTRRFNVANHQAIADLRNDLQTFREASLRRLKVDAESARRKRKRSTGAQTRANAEVARQRIQMGNL